MRGSMIADVHKRHQGKKPAVFGPMTDHERPGLRDRKIRLGYACVNFISSICGKVGPTAGIESLPRQVIHRIQLHQQRRLRQHRRLAFLLSEKSGNALSTSSTRTGSTSIFIALARVANNSGKPISL